MLDEESDSEIVESLDSDFAIRLSREIGGETVKYCFQCGTCSSVCPVGQIDSGLNPKRIMKMVLLNMEEELVKSDFIWLCTTCYSCYERCPQGVKIPYVIDAIKRLASERGHAHMNFIAGAGLLEAHGRLVEVNKFINKTREKLGMPPIEEHNEDIKILLAKAEVLNIMERKKKGDGDH
jgi:heterodisulfide reductase subunit C